MRRVRCVFGGLNRRPHHRRGARSSLMPNPPSGGYWNAPFLFDAPSSILVLRILSKGLGHLDTGGQNSTPHETHPCDAKRAGLSRLWKTPSGLRASASIPVRIRPLLGPTKRRPESRPNDASRARGPALTYHPPEAFSCRQNPSFLPGLTAPANAKRKPKKSRAKG